MKQWWWIVVGVFMLVHWFIFRSRRRVEHPLVPLASAMQHMKTGDLLLFSKRDVPDVGRVVPLFCNYFNRGFDGSEFQHVEVVYRDAGNNVYCMSCSPKGCKDIFCGEPVTGVQCVLLSEKLRAMHGYCLWQPINHALDNEACLRFLKETYGSHYEFPILDIARRFVESADGQTALNKHGGVFCTQWVGALYEHAGVFDTRKRPFKGYYFPGDFEQVRSRAFLADGWKFLDGLELTDLEK